MKISDFLSKKDFAKFQQFCPEWEYSTEYSETEIDRLDETLEGLEQIYGYGSETSIFINDVIYKLRTNPNY